MVKSILPFKRLLISKVKVNNFSTCNATSAVTSFRFSRTKSRSLSKSVSFHTKPPKSAISLSVAQAIQSSISSATLPNGAKYKPSLDLFGSFSCRYLIGDGTFNNNKRRKPCCIATACSYSVSNNLMPTASFSSVMAGKAFTVKPRFFCSNTCGKLSKFQI